MRTIEINTTQNVKIEYELAPLRDRFFALVIDGMIVGVAYSIVTLALGLGMRGDLVQSGLDQNLISYFLPIGMFLFYQLLSEIIADGRSWGKKALGIKVVRLDGKEPSFSDYLLRMIFHLIDTFGSFGILAAFLISSSGNSQRLGDMTANTTVIKVRFDLRFRLEDILKINSIEDYEPTYPEVRKLSEKDMLLIKMSINRYRKHKNKAHADVINQLVTKLRKQLDIIEEPKNKIEFLKTLIRDYIVLTR